MCRSTINKKNIINKQKGFTLLEMILVVAMISLIATFAPPIFVQVQHKFGFDGSVQAYVDSLYRAQDLSSATLDDSSWGVKISDKDVTLFKGNSYINRDVNFDEVTTFLADLNVTGDTEFIFNKVYGTPELSGTTIIQDKTGYEDNVSVNQAGLISF